MWISWIYEAEILKLNKDELQKCVLHIKNNFSPGLTNYNLILNSLQEIKADIKQLQYDTKEMKDGFTPVISKNISSSVSNNLSKLEKEYSELQLYSGRPNVTTLDLLTPLLGNV